MPLSPTIASKQQSSSMWKRGFVALGGTAIALALSCVKTAPAIAQAAYGSYIGIGPSFGLTEGSGSDEDRAIAGNLAVRYKFLKAPVSLRSQILVGENTAFVPTISYDFPISWQADAYLGAGAAIINGNKSTPVGNDTAFVLQPGIDYVLPNSNLVIFGNAIIAFDAYRSVNKRTAVSLQGGVGLRF